MDLKTLSDAPAPAPAPTASPSAPPAPQEKPYEPMVHGESAYDRVTSMLMSVVVGAALIVGWLTLMYYATQAYAAKVPSKIEIVEVTGGGSLDGTFGENEGNAVDNAEVGATASNNTDDASAFDDPVVQEASTVVLDAMAEQQEEASDEAESSSSENSRPTSAVAGGKRRSQVGTGGIGLGIGGGPGSGVARELRWVIVYPQGQSEDEYAKQLDHFGIELATISGSNTLLYGSNFSGAPNRRTGLSGEDKRWYLSWQGRGRKQFDVLLMKRAGIEVGDKPIFQFFPPKLEEALAQMEVAYKGRQPAEIRQTKFTAVSSGSGYTFKVLSQDALR